MTNRMPPSSSTTSSSSTPTTPTSPPARDERFLSRWSRLKRAQANGAPVPEVAAPAAGSAAAAPASVPPRDAAQPQPDGIPLPPIDSLTIESDYAQFFQPKVPEALRRAAVKKLFADPHFNVMDGLDTYIDDYTKFEPISEEMLKTLVQAKNIVNHPSDWTDEEIGVKARLFAEQEGVGAAAPVVEIGVRARLNTATLTSADAPGQLGSDTDSLADTDGVGEFDVAPEMGVRARLDPETLTGAVASGVHSAASIADASGKSGFDTDSLPADTDSLPRPGNRALTPIPRPANRALTPIPPDTDTDTGSDTGSDTHRIPRP